MKLKLRGDELQSYDQTTRRSLWRGKRRNKNFIFHLLLLRPFISSTLSLSFLLSAPSTTWWILIGIQWSPGIKSWWDSLLLVLSSYRATCKDIFRESLNSSETFFLSECLENTRPQLVDIKSHRRWYKEARVVIIDSRVFYSRLIRLDVELRNFRYFDVKQFSCHVQSYSPLIITRAPKAFTRTFETKTKHVLHNEAER